MLYTCHCHKWFTILKVNGLLIFTIRTKLALLQNCKTESYHFDYYNILVDWVFRILILLLAVANNQPLLLLIDSPVFRLQAFVGKISCYLGPQFAIVPVRLWTSKFLKPGSSSIIYKCKFLRRYRAELTLTVCCVCSKDLDGWKL